MASSTLEVARSRLASLSGSAAGIESLSLWACHVGSQTSAASDIVQAWRESVEAASQGSRAVTLLHLANDLVQKSKDVYNGLFQPVLPEAVSRTISVCSSSELGKVLRVVDVWNQRGVYPRDFLDPLRQMLLKAGAPQQPRPSSSGSSKHRHTPSSRDTSPASSTSPNYSTQHSGKSAKRKSSASLGSASSKSRAANITASTLDEAAGEADETRLSDQAHKHIADLDPSLFDTDVVFSLTDRPSGEALQKQLLSTMKEIASYQGRLAADVEDRQSMLRTLEALIIKFKKDVKQLKTAIEHVESWRGEADLIEKAVEDRRKQLQGNKTTNLMTEPVSPVREKAINISSNGASGRPTAATSTLSPTKRSADTAGRIPQSPTKVAKQSDVPVPGRPLHATGSDGSQRPPDHGPRAGPGHQYHPYPGSQLPAPQRGAIPATYNYAPRTAASQSSYAASGHMNPPPYGQGRAGPPSHPPQPYSYRPHHQRHSHPPPSH